MGLDRMWAGFKPNQCMGQLLDAREAWHWIAQLLAAREAWHWIAQLLAAIPTTTS
jgi:hypothetical protein